MPSIRIGFSTDFNLTGEQIGIGTTNPTARLDVAGQIRSDDSAGSGGVSTVTRYAGFLDEAQGLGNTVSIAETSKGNLNSLSGEIKISGEVTVTEDTKLTGGRLDSLTVTGKFDLPHGGSEDREDTPEKGSTRFNQDLGQLEFYTGYEWITTLSYARPDGAGRGVFGGGQETVAVDAIDYVNITTTGNAQDFGDLTSARQAQPNGGSNGIRGLFSAGSPNTGQTDYITIASEGNAISFGDLTSYDPDFSGGCSSSTRYIVAGGRSPTVTNVSTIQYLEISTLGNGETFGDLTRAKFIISGCSSPTRGLFGGGNTPGSGGTLLSEIDLITIASIGNAIDFGDLTAARAISSSSFSNSVRGVWGGGYNTGASPSVSGYGGIIDYVTIATVGNAVDFGEPSVETYGSAGAATQTRGVFAGGQTPTKINTIDFITIMTQGNAQDFGDSTVARRSGGGLSDSHGGLGGF